MSEVVEAQVFHEPLSAAERETVEAMVGRHKANAARTQQLALDAAKLLTSSQQRLDKQRSTGFFKRFAQTVSGKTSENQQLNQADSLQMQKYAWHYLKELQQQNLINAQSIAVIRNNLGTMNDYIIETREFLGQAIEKIDRRLTRVENSTSFHSWALNIEANKRRFKSIPPTLLVLHLTYDFMNRHSHIELSSRDVNHLVVTLEKLGIDCDKEMELLNFIIELIDELEVTGIDRFRSMIELSFDEHQVDAHFIQKNISGIAFNALYYLSEQYEKIIDLTDNNELCNSDEARETIISKFFGEEFSGLYANYGIRDLIGELIGGSQLAIEIYKDVNGLNALPDVEEQEEPAATVSLVSVLPDIHAHTFFDTTRDEGAKRSYLQLFALCVESSAQLSQLAREFIGQLATHAGCPNVTEEVVRLADEPARYRDYLPLLPSVLNNENLVYTWLLDAFFLLDLCQQKVENPQVVRILGALKPIQFKERFTDVQALLTEQNPKQWLEAAQRSNPYTRGWQNLRRYRALSFESVFADLQKRLNQVVFDNLQVSMDIMKATSKASDFSYFFDSGSEGFFGKLGSGVASQACALGRKTALSSLNGVRKKVQDFISARTGLLSEANRIMNKWSIARIDYTDELGHADFDLDNSAHNEDWYDQYRHYERQVDSTLTAFTDACSDAGDQLGHFAAGNFDVSAVAAKAQKIAERKLRDQQEKLTKQSVTIAKYGSEHLFTIAWEQLETPPCDPEHIREIKTDGAVWLVADKDDVLYRSEDLKQWQRLQPHVDEDGRLLSIRKLSVVNGVWIMFAGYSSALYYSHDGRDWKQAMLPDTGGRYDLSMVEEISYFSGLWLWRYTERAEYSYTDKGIIFDSTETSTYYKPVIYSTADLTQPWALWEATPRFPEGVVVESFHALPDAPCLLAYCKYDSFYTRIKKKTNAEPFVSYLIPGKEWKTCTWGGKLSEFYGPFITRMTNRLLSFNGGQLLVSDKGYDWQIQQEDLHIADVFHLEVASLFIANNAKSCYVSQDGEAFSEMVFDEGSWRYLCANDQAALSVYAPNSHETFLRVGRYICLPKG